MRRNAVKTPNLDEVENVPVNGKQTVSSISTDALARSPLNTIPEDSNVVDHYEDPSFWMDHYVQIVLRNSPLNDMELSTYYKRCIEQESAQCLSIVAHSEAPFIFNHLACETIDQVNQDASGDAMASPHQIQLLKVFQREQENKCTKMMLKFREDKINRMDSLLAGSIPADSYLLEGNNMHTKEVRMLRSKADRNPEVTRFALENISLLEQLRW